MDECSDNVLVQICVTRLQNTIEIRNVRERNAADECRKGSGKDDPHQRWIKWPDFRAPTDTGQALNELQTAFERCAEERVLISCRGGVGRTGTALTVMGMLAGMRCGCAVEWVRERYSPRAVETVFQRRWLNTVDDILFA